MVRTQSIISVSDEIGGNAGGSASNVGQETRDGSITTITRKNRIRGRRLMTKTLKNISGSSQEDTKDGKDVLERIGLPREESLAKSCSPCHRRGGNSPSGLRYFYTIILL